MSKIVIRGLPKPPPGTEFCLICTNDYRTAFNEAWDIEKIIGDGLDEVRVLSGWPQGSEIPAPPEIAVALGLSSELQQMGGITFVKLCWKHFTPFKFSAVAMQPGMSMDQVAAAMQAAGGQPLARGRR